MSWSVLTPTAFAKWLGTKKPSDYVGNGFATEYCPLATYLQERLQRDDVQVTNDEVVIGEERVPLRPWAKTFVRYVDRAHPRRGPVRAGEAMDFFMFSTRWFAAERLYAPKWRRPNGKVA